MSVALLAVATLVAFGYLAVRVWWLSHLVRRLEARLRAYELVLRLPEVDVATGKLPPPARRERPAVAHPPGVPEAEAGSPGADTEAWRDEVARAAQAGRRVEAVILYRKHTGAGLAEAVEAVKRLRG